jgi:rod shape-determining protein MreD
VSLIQGVLLSRVRVWSGQPELMLLVVLSWATLRGEGEGLVWAFAGGLLLDLLSGGPTGTITLALIGAAFLAGLPWGEELDSRILRPLLAAITGVTAYHLILLVVLAWTGRSVDWGFSLLRVAGPSVLLNTLLAPLVQLPLAWIERRTRRERYTL